MRPEGTLTPVQYEILEAVWAAGDRGATIQEIRDAIAARRQVARTTVLNLASRLERRGWLVAREPEGGRARRFLAAVGREAAAAFLAREFVDDFFAGSAASLVQGLLGSGRITEAELQRLERLLAERQRVKPGRRSRPERRRRGGKSDD